MKKGRPSSLNETERLRNRLQNNFKEGQRVSLRISGQTRIGYKAIVNDTHEGILYKNEVFQPLKKGQRVDGFVKKQREDEKIDLSLYEPGYKKINVLAKKLISILKERGGFVEITDNSSPQTISALFGISKKTYKKVAGNLYRKRQIALEKDGIRLIKNGDTR